MYSIKERERQSVCEKERVIERKILGRIQMSKLLVILLILSNIFEWTYTLICCLKEKC